MVEEKTLSNLLLDASQEIFETMILMEIEKDTEPIVFTDETMVATITFSGSEEGCLSLCCHATCANQIAKNMLGLEDSEEVSLEEVADALGEVANMIMGSVKTHIADNDIQLSIPSVVLGHALKSNLGDWSVCSIQRVRANEWHSIELALHFRGRH